MPITNHQRRLRRGHIGSSDAPIIIGVPCYGRNTADVYWSKIAEQGDDEPTMAMQTGNRLEGPLVDFACQELGVQCVRNQFRVSDRGDGIPAANFDALITGKCEAIECKYVGPTNADQWGQPGTDECPDHVLVQCQHQMMVGNLDRVWVAAAIARFQLEWVIYSVPRSDPIIDALLETEVSFWNDHVMPGIPPDDAPPPLEILKRLRREPQSIVHLDEAAEKIWQRRQLTAEAKKIAESDYESATREVLQCLGDAEAGVLPNGSMITYLSQRGALRFNQSGLKLAHPEIYKQFSEETNHRVMRLKKAKVE